MDTAVQNQVRFLTRMAIVMSVAFLALAALVVKAVTQSPRLFDVVILATGTLAIGHWAIELIDERRQLRRFGRDKRPAARATRLWATAVFLTGMLFAASVVYIWRVEGEHALPCAIAWFATMCHALRLETRKKRLRTMAQANVVVPRVPQAR